MLGGRDDKDVFVGRVRQIFNAVYVNRIGDMPLQIFLPAFLPHYVMIGKAPGKADLHHPNLRIVQVVGQPLGLYKHVLLKFFSLSSGDDAPIRGLFFSYPLAKQGILVAMIVIN
jgi:hypothetical protein